jgi:hypothetical protein
MRLKIKKAGVSRRINVEVNCSRRQEQKRNNEEERWYQGEKS